MNGLAALFAKLETGLGRSEDPDFPAISRQATRQLEGQPYDKKRFSSVSRISRLEKPATQFSENESAQAGAGVWAGAGARGYRAESLETLETLENPTPAEGCLSSSLFRKLERLEKGSAPLPAFPSLDALAACDERAGFLEYDCGLSREAAESQAGLELHLDTATSASPATARLPDRDSLALWRAGLDRLSSHTVPCPGYREGEWLRVYANARSFLDHFGEQAEALGWTAPRLFGVHPEAGIVRVDQCGALVLPIGGPALAITATEIQFSHLTHREKPGRVDGVPVWNFAR